MNDHEDHSPVGTMGKLRGNKVVTWIVIGSLLVLTIGGGILYFVLSTLSR